MGFGDNTLPMTPDTTTTTTTTVLVQLGQAESANYSYSELSYVSAKLYRCSVD